MLLEVKRKAKPPLLVGTVMLGFQSIFMKSQGSSPFEALNSAQLSMCQRVVRPSVQNRWRSMEFSRVSTWIQSSLHIVRWKMSLLLNCGVGEESWEFLGLKKIQPVYPKGNQPWISIGRTDTKAETPILWPPDVKNWLIGKDPDAGKDWRQEEKGMTEDETVGWHH